MGSEYAGGLGGGVPVVITSSMNGDGARMQVRVPSQPDSARGCGRVRVPTDRRSPRSRTAVNRAGVTRTRGPSRDAAVRAIAVTGSPPRRRAEWRESGAGTSCSE